MLYDYIVRKELFITISVEADSEEGADDAYEKAVLRGELDEAFQNELAHADSEITDVYELRDGDYRHIYHID